MFRLRRRRGRLRSAAAPPVRLEEGLATDRGEKIARFPLWTEAAKERREPHCSAPLVPAANLLEPVPKTLA